MSTAKRIAIFALSTGIGAFVASRVPGILGNSFDVHTDIVGYPIVTPFNAYRYTDRYYATVAVFPVVSLVIYAVLARVLRLGGTGASLPQLATDDEPAVVPPWRRWLTAAALSGLVAFALGVEAILIIGEDMSRPSVLVGCGFLYLAVLAGAILLSPRSSNFESARGRIATVNTFAAPLLVLGLYGVSRSTTVRVLSNGTVHHFAWFPAWVAVLIALAVLGLVVRGRRVARTSDDVARLERRAITLVVGPTLLFLFVSAVPVAMGLTDWFHEGEGLVGARLVSNGAFPYRDFISIHGPIEDVLVRLLGINVFQNSLWGSRAGISVLLVPLYWIALYYLNAYLFRRNWVFLVTPFVLVVAGHAALFGLFTPVYLRFILIPPLLLLFAALLRKPSATRAGVFVALLTVQVVGSPEAAFAVPGFAITLLAYEWYYRTPGQPLLSSFTRTRLCLIAGLATTVLTVAILAANNALGDFINFFTTFSRGHALTGALPLAQTPVRLAIATYVPVAAVLLTMWFFCARIRGRRPLALDDWVMLPAAILVLLYIPKSLIRSDAHLLATWAVATPLICYVVYRATDFSERAAQRTRAGIMVGRKLGPHVISLAIAIALIAPAAHVLPHRVHYVAARYQRTVPEPVHVARLGYVLPGLEGKEVLRDIRSIVSTVTSRKDQVFDFTNAPGYFYYLLGYETPTRYYHVSTAIRADTQADLISELRSSRPAIVVYEGVPGLSSWDGIPNEVRHYDVSKYLLDHYRPMARYWGFLFLLRNDIGDPKAKLRVLDPATPIELNHLYAKSIGCPWGRAPDNLDRRPASGASRTAPLPVRRETGPHSVREVISVPPDAASYGWIEITTDTGFRHDAFTLAPSGVARARRITFATSARSPHEYLVKVGNCIQWRGWKGTELVLTHGHAQDIRSVRLIH